MNIADIIEAIQSNRVRITDHADEEASADKLTLEEVYYSLLHGEVIEDYATDRPYPSCVIFGKTFGGVAVHSVWAYNMESRWAVLDHSIPA